MTRGAVLSMLLLSTSAFADSGYPDEPPPPYPLAPPSAVMPVAMTPVYPAPPIEGPKSAGTAGLLSFFATVAPPLIAASAYGDDQGDDNEGAMLTIMLGSVMIGPSIGHLYAGKLITPGLGVRALGFVLGMAAFGADDLDDAVGLLLLGTTCVIGGAIADIATAGRSAREYNFEHAKRMMPTIAPVIGPDGSTQVRLGLVGKF